MLGNISDNIHRIERAKQWDIYTLNHADVHWNDPAILGEHRSQLITHLYLFLDLVRSKAVFREKSSHTHTSDIS